VSTVAREGELASQGFWRELTLKLVAPCSVALTTLAFASTAVAAAPSIVRDIAPGSASSHPIRLAEVGGKLFFSAPGATEFRAPWVSDGTELGTVSLGQTCEDIGAPNADETPYEYTDVNGTAFFSCFYDGALWTSDGTPAGTVFVQDGLDALQEFTAMNGALFFASLDEGADAWPLWKTDGTTVELVKNGLIATDLINVGGTLFSTDGQNPLWKSDGTPAGTKLVKRWPGSALGDTFVLEQTAVGQTLFFIVDSVDRYGTELWKSDGTKAGTVLVKDIRPGPKSSHPLKLTARRGKIYFSANDGVHGRELWKSDGTRAGTVLVKDIRRGPRGSEPERITPAFGRSRIAFSAYDGFHGRELWRSNGKAAGTALVRDLLPGRDSSLPTRLTNVNGTVAFAATDGTHGRELWLTDGTARGTLLIDIHPFAGSSPQGLTNVAGTLFFSAKDGVNGRELWAITP
jgi:ELWxxDGT repeat protein